MKQKTLLKKFKSLEDSGLLLKGVTETVQNEIKELKEGFLSMLLGTLGASLLGNLLTGRGVNKKGKRIVRAEEGATKSNRQGKGIVGAGYGRPSSSASHNKKRQKNNRKDF